MLASHAAHRSLPIASTTKMMTAYVALHDLPLDKVVRAAPYHPIYGESLLELRTGQRVSVRDLLYGLILRSGNDAANDLALAAAGSDARFVNEMNRHAAALGLTDTHYANPVGLDEKGNYSSAYDLTALGRRCSKSRPSRRSPTPGRRSSAASTRRAGSKRSTTSCSRCRGRTGSRPGTPSPPTTSWSAPASARASS